MQKQLSQLQSTSLSRLSIWLYAREALVPAAALLSALFYTQPWLQDGGIELVRPFVYRQFIPLTASLIAMLTGMALGPSVVTVIVLCAIGFALASAWLYQSFYQQESAKAALFALLMVGILFAMIEYPKHNYDVATAFFFTLALVLLQRERLIAYACLFPLICLNRETALLLPLLFAVHFFRKLEPKLYWGSLFYQLISFLVIRVALMWIFAQVPGSMFYFRPAENLQMYSMAPLTTNFFLLFLVTVVCLVAAKWTSAPALMRTAFLIFAPILVILYLFLGTSFEIRVFVELLPVVAIIGAS